MNALCQGYFRNSCQDPGMHYYFLEMLTQVCLLRENEYVLLIYLLERSLETSLPGFFYFFPLQCLCSKRQTFSNAYLSFLIDFMKQLPSLHIQSFQFAATTKKTFSECIFYILFFLPQFTARIVVRRTNVT